MWQLGVETILKEANRLRVHIPLPLHICSRDSNHRNFATKTHPLPVRVFLLCSILHVVYRHHRQDILLYFTSAEVGSYPPRKLRPFLSTVRAAPLTSGREKKNAWEILPPCGPTIFSRSTRVHVHLHTCFYVCTCVCKCIVDKKPVTYPRLGKNSSKIAHGVGTLIHGFSFFSLRR